MKYYVNAQYWPRRPPEIPSPLLIFLALSPLASAVSGATPSARLHQGTTMPNLRRRDLEISGKIASFQGLSYEQKMPTTVPSVPNKRMALRQLEGGGLNDLESFFDTLHTLEPKPGETESNMGSNAGSNAGSNVLVMVIGSVAAVVAVLIAAATFFIRHRRGNDDSGSNIENAGKVKGRGKGKDTGYEVKKNQGKKSKKSNHDTYDSKNDNKSKSRRKRRKEKYDTGDSENENKSKSRRKKRKEKYDTGDSENENKIKRKGKITKRRTKHDYDDDDNDNMGTDDSNKRKEHSDDNEYENIEDNNIESERNGEGNRCSRKITKKGSYKNKSIASGGGKSISSRRSKRSKMKSVRDREGSFEGVGSAVEASIAALMGANSYKSGMEDSGNESNEEDNIMPRGYIGKIPKNGKRPNINICISYGSENKDDGKNDIRDSQGFSRTNSWEYLTHDSNDTSHKSHQSMRSSDSPPIIHHHSSIISVDHTQSSRPVLNQIDSSSQSRSHIHASSHSVNYSRHSSRPVHSSDLSLSRSRSNTNSSNIPDEVSAILPNITSLDHNIHPPQVQNSHERNDFEPNMTTLDPKNNHITPVGHRIKASRIQNTANISDTETNISDTETTFAWNSFQETTVLEKIFLNPDGSCSKKIECVAFPGKLGIVIGKVDGGFPVVNVIRSTSPLIQFIVCGDRLFSIDEENVSNLSTQQVLEVISEKSNNPERILVFVRKMPGSVSKSLQDSCGSIKSV